MTPQGSPYICLTLRRILALIMNQAFLDRLAHIVRSHTSEITFAAILEDVEALELEFGLSSFPETETGARGEEPPSHPPQTLDVAG